MAAEKKTTTLLLNWYANPYHTPIFVAKAKGFYAEEGINLAILECTNPSDVTEIVGKKNVDLGLKAMIHTIAAKDRNIDLTSFGTLLDEPPTGLIALKSSGISEFKDIVGKKVGYIGHFGKVMVDDLAKQAGIDPNSYETVRVGMNVADAIRRGVIDTGIGFINFQKVELEEMCGEEVVMLRIDELADLGCCCFCSVLYIAHDDVLKEQPEMIKAFMRATRRGTDYTIENPDEAWELFCQQMPLLRNPIYEKVYQRTLPYFSRTLLNVDRDWEKVTKYCKHLGVAEPNFTPTECWTNEFVPMMGKPRLEPVAHCLDEEKD